MTAAVEAVAAVMDRPRGEEDWLEGSSSVLGAAR